MPLNVSVCGAVALCVGCFASGILFSPSVLSAAVDGVVGGCCAGLGTSALISCCNPRITESTLFLTVWTSTDFITGVCVISVFHPLCEKAGGSSLLSVA